MEKYENELPCKKLKIDEEESITLEKNDDGSNVEPTLSKKAKKRLEKEKQWEKSKGQRVEKRKLMRENKKTKRQDLKKEIEEKETLGEDVSELQEKLKDSKQNRINKDEKEKLHEKMKVGSKIIIDCNFEEHMKDKELNSLVTQFSHFLSDNKNSEKPINVILTGVGPRLKQQLVKREAYKWNAWLSQIYDEDYNKMFDKKDLVYLTGDSDKDMGKFDPNTLYIVGGLIDHNKLKNITLNKAKDEEIRHERFPIADYVSLKQCGILAVNHVLNILLKLNEGKNWTETFNEALPKRKMDDEAEK